MRQGIQNFQPERLTQARESLGMTKVALSRVIGVSSATVSKWESGKQSPEERHLSSVSSFLRVPTHWFTKPLDHSSGKPFFFRSQTATTKTARAIAKVQLKWAMEIAQTLQEWVELPAIDLPIVEETNVLNIADDEIIDLANECRRRWGIGDAPIADVLLAMENAGIVCVKGELGHTKMDGVSHWGADGRPYVFISTDKANGIRNRFDAAHELAHLITHSKVSEADYRKHYKEIERQANLFAGAFLLPETSFAQDIALPTLDGFLSMKKRWKVSISAMIMRSHQLNIIDDNEKLRLYKGRSAKGWATREPYDDIPPEQPRLLHRSVKIITDHGILNKESLLDKLALDETLCEKLCNLEDGFFMGMADHKLDNLVILKNTLSNHGNTKGRSGNVINFPSKSV